MAALVGHSGGTTEAMKGADKGSAAATAAATATVIDGIDYEEEAQARGMRLVSCTRVGSRKASSGAIVVVAAPGMC